MAIRKDVVQLSIEINGVKAGQQYNELRSKARNLNRELAKLEPGTEAFIAKTAELKGVNNVLATIRKTTAGVATEIDGAGKKVNPFIDILKKGAIASIAFFSVGRVIEWGKQFLSFIFKGTAALEAMRAKSAVVFGDAIDLVEDFAAINASSLGLTEEKYISLAAAIADLLIPMQFTREQAAKMSSDLLNLSGALSEWTNGQRTAEEVSKILGKAILGEREGLKELGISIKESDVSARLLAKGQKQLTGTMLEQAKATATLELIMEKSQDAQTRFRNNQDGVNRTMSRTSAIMERAKESFLKNFLPFISSLTTRWADSVAPVKRHSDALEEQLFKFRQYLKVLQSGEITEKERIKLLAQVNAQYKLQGENTLTLTSNREDYLRVEKLVSDELLRQIKIETAKEVFLDARNAVIKAEAAQTVAVGKRINAEQRLNAVLSDRLKIDDFGGTTAKDVLSASFSSASEDVEKAKEAVQDAHRELELTKKALAEYGIDAAELLKILEGGFTPPDGADDTTKKSAEKRAFEAELDRIELLTQQQIAANERIVQSDEVAAIKRQVIESNSATLIAKARIRIFSRAKLEEERLSLGDIEKLKNENNQREIDRIKLQSKLTLQERTELIEQRQQLEIQALDELELIEEQKIRRIAIIDQQAELDKRRAKLETANLIGADLTEAQNAVAEQETLVNKLVAEDLVETTNEVIEIRRNLLLAGIHQYQLDEVDLNTERQRINLEADIAIMQNRLALYEEGSVEALKIETALADARAKLGAISFVVPDQGGGSSEFNENFSSKQRARQAKLGLTDDELSDLLEREAQIRQLALDGATTVANGIIDIESNRIERELQQELEAIDRITEAKLAAAEGDSVLQKKINAEALRDKEKAENEAAKKRKKVAIADAIIQGALAVISNLKISPFAAIAAGIAAAAQLAVIQSTTFAKGGYTAKKGIYKDHTGHEVVGVVHDGEYVAPKWMVNDPRTRPTISYLEQVRRSRGGYADGGFTSASTTPAASVQGISSTASAADTAKMISLLESLNRKFDMWPRDLKARLVYTELEKFTADLQYIQDKATA